MFSQLILTPKGEVPIVDIQVDDEVVGYNEETGEKEIYTVAQKGIFGKSKNTKHWYIINNKYHFASHQSIYANGLVTHVFRLKAGDVLRDVNGENVVVETIAQEKFKAPKILLTIENKASEKQFHTYYMNGLLVHNASRYWVGGTASWDATAGSKWAATSGGGSGSSVPTAADDVFLDAASGAVTVTIGTTNVFCRSLDTNGYTGTLNGGNWDRNVNIGDGTPGAGNIALRFTSGMTLTNSGGFNFLSTSATVQDVDFAGKTTGFVTFNGTGGSWKYTGSHLQPNSTSMNVNLARGTLDTNGQACTWCSFVSSNTNARSLLLGASIITLNGTSANVSRLWDVSNATNFTLNAGTSSIVCTGDMNTSITIFAGGANKTYYSLTFTGAITGSGVIIGFGPLTFTNLTFTGTAAKTNQYLMTPAELVTVTGTLTANGNSGSNRILISSSTLGTPLTINAAAVSISNADLQDITGAGAASWNISAGNTGDCGGNTNITFTSPTTQTATMATNKNWSDVSIWTSRVPLPQDTVSLSGVTGGTLTADMPRLGKDISWTGATGSPTWNLNSVATTFYGSVTCISGMSVTTSGSSSNPISLNGRGAHTLTSAGKQFNANVTIRSIGGSYTLQDNFYSNRDFTHNNGGLILNGNKLSVKIFQGSNATRSLNLTNSTIDILSTDSGAVVTISGTGLTLSASGSTINIVNASSNARSISASGLSFGTLNYTVAGSTGKFTISASTTFENINFSDANNARTLEVGNGTTLTVSNNFNVNGTSGKLMSLRSVIAGTRFNLVLGNTHTTNYCDIKDANVSGAGAPMMCTTGGVNSGNNVNVIFNVPTKTLTENLTVNDNMLTSVGRVFSETINISSTVIKQPGKTFSEAIIVANIEQDTQTDEYVEIGNAVWDHDAPGITITTPGSNNINSVVFLSGANVKQRTVQCDLTFTSIGTHEEDRIGIAFLVDGETDNGLYFVFRAGHFIQLLDSNQGWYGVSERVPQVGETWRIKAVLFADNYFFGKVWNIEEPEPDEWNYVNLITPFINPEYVYSGLLGGTAAYENGYNAVFTNYSVTYENGISFSIARTFHETLNFTASFYRSLGKVLTQEMTFTNVLEMNRIRRKILTETIYIADRFLNKIQLAGASVGTWFRKRRRSWFTK